MRENKFKCWNPYQKIMHSPFTLYQLAVGEVVIPSQCFDHMLQCTGLKDKDGVDICEGDIVSVVDWDGEPVGSYLIKFCQDGHSDCIGFHEYDLKTGELNYFYGGLTYVANEDHVVTVIGNKYENPEILKGE